jgi:hypothetical protein
LSTSSAITDRIARNSRGEHIGQPGIAEGRGFCCRGAMRRRLGLALIGARHFAQAALGH